MKKESIKVWAAVACLLVCMGAMVSSCGSSGKDAASEEKGDSLTASETAEEDALAAVRAAALEKYDDVWNFSEGLAVVKLDGKWGMINEKGEEVVPCKYDLIVWRNGNDVMEVVLDGKWGLLDKEGREVMPCKYEYTSGLYDGLMIVENDFKYGVVNSKGEEVVPLKYERIEDFYKGVAIVARGGVWEKSDDDIYELEGAKYGFINEKGEEVIPCKYDRVGYLDNGTFWVMLGGKEGFVDKEGRETFSVSTETEEKE